MLVAAWGLPGPGPHIRVPAGPGSPASTADTTALAALWVFFFGTVTPGLLAFAYAAPIVTERGMAPGAAGLVVSLMSAGNLVGRLLPAPLMNRTGLLPLLWGGVVALALSLVLLSSVRAGAVLASALAVLALQYGLVSALLPSATRPVAGDTRFAGAYGRVFSAWGVAGVVGPYVGASLHGESDGYVRAFGASLVFVLLAAGALVVYQHRTGHRHGR
jgi:OFA family oxalate/formate antiporter-like MFS transporter